MTKQQQIDALTNENVAMSRLLQQMADHMPAIADVLGENGYIAAEFTMRGWLREMAAMDITPEGQVQS